MKYLSILITCLMLLCTGLSDSQDPVLEVFAGNDITVVTNDTINFRGEYRPDVDVEIFNWYVLKDTIRQLTIQTQKLQYIAPDSACTLNFAFQVKALNGAIDEDTVVVYVVPDTVIIVNAGKDQNALVDLPVVLNATYSGDNIVGTFWKIGSSNFVPASPETTFIASGIPSFLPCIFKVVASDNREAVDTVNINIITLDSLNIITANAGNDTSVVTGSQLMLRGTYTGKSVTGTFWKIGNSDFIPATLDTVIVLPNTPTVIKCILKVRGVYMEALDTVKISVLYNIPLSAVAFDDTIIQARSQLKIHGSYLGNVQKIFWKIGNGPFIQSLPETTIIVPDTTLVCIFKVQDFNLNESIDTAIVTVVDTNAVYANVGNDTTIIANSLLKLKGTYTGNVINTFWKIGVNDFVPVSVETTIVVPSVPILLPCIFRVVGVNSIYDEDTLNVNVISDTGKVTSRAGMVLISSKGKVFRMGSMINAMASPAHNVTFTKNFFMSKTEITQREYELLLSMNPSSIKNNNYPVYNCNWFDAVYYCNARSKSEGLDTVYSYTSIGGTIGYQCHMENVKINYTKKGYRLPTESEWEFACRAGSTTDYYWGNHVNGRYFWYKNNSTTISILNPFGYPSPKKVGSKLPNTFGLYDMSGNVKEWCNDWYAPYIAEGLVDTIIGKIDPRGPSDSPTLYFRVVRNGSYAEAADRSRSFSRSPSVPHRLNEDTGFRVVIEQ